jgi:hypothetical protein
MSQVWCPKCEQGGDFIKIIETRPSSWTCPQCKTRFFLPPSFYESPIHLYLENELPTEVLQRVLPPKNRLHKLVVILMGIVFLLAFFFIFITSNILHKPLLIGISVIVSIILFIILARWDTKNLSKN